MANDLASNPIIIDTALTSTYKGDGGLPANQPIIIKKVYWLAPATTGDDFSLTRPDGSVLLNGICESDGQSQLFENLNFYLNDFSVPTIDSGTLYIYY